MELSGYPATAICDNMRICSIILGTLLLAAAALGQTAAVGTDGVRGTDPSNYIWFSSPAAKWDEALPVGNGRLGAMIFGGIAEERLQLNEDTYWSGGPYSTVVKGGYKVLPEIQRLVFAERYLEAHNLFGRNLMGYPVEQQKYQSLANLHLFFDHGKDATDYQRSLDLKTGISTNVYTANGIRYRREVLSSSPDQVIAVRLTADRPGSITLTANLRGVRNQAHSNYGTDYFRMDPVGQDGLAVTGKSADYLGVAGKLRYEGRLKAFADGGSVRTNGVDLRIEKADAVTLYFAAATNFVDYRDVSGDQHRRVEDYLRNVNGKSYETVKTAALSDYKALYDRASLSLPGTASSSLPTNERKEKAQTLPDPSLAALAYNFGRYLLISSSRPGTQPANLQGIWNDDQNPAWDSKYTTNINAQMNYWAVDSANLSELGTPFYKMISELTDQGSQVAREHYGASGWVFHQNTDIWRVAAPMDGPSWGTFTVGGAWLTTHLWEHYEYSQDKAFLNENYPVMEGSVRFFMDYLVKHPNGKWLVTNPSTSPENFPDGGGNKPYFDEVTGSRIPGTTICAGSSIDMQILHDLFGYYLKAAEILGRKTPLVERVRTARDQLVPPQIGSDGSLQEWADDWRSLEKNHRHFSHLYGLYPGRVLWDKRTPVLIEAYKKVLNERGDGGKGFSMAWKMALWARLGDGNRANKIFKGYLNEQSCSQLFALCGKSLQVDGSLGVTAAITEMLMQSQDSVIDLLPALPDEWPSGEFRGVRTRGGFELEFQWADKRIMRLKVTSKAGGSFRLKADSRLNITANGTRRTMTPKDGIVEFPTVKGGEYLLQLP
ncbi:MAG: glycoside hydrolase family 95 protein [Pyrinomonadaceae bacterium]|nr:glycoside hydrolase family 95 protein [Pyrinomonadaceae bacterium]MBP6212492.1 glycoside hydrolase family 95 protein [Pyrinomonadaceae bacterium]